MMIALCLAFFISTEVLERMVSNVDVLVYLLFRGVKPSLRMGDHMFIFRWIDFFHTLFTGHVALANHGGVFPDIGMELVALAMDLIGIGIEQTVGGIGVGIVRLDPSEGFDPFYNSLFIIG